MRIIIEQYKGLTLAEWAEMQKVIESILDTVVSDYFYLELAKVWKKAKEKKDYTLSRFWQEICLDGVMRIKTLEVKYIDGIGKTLAVEAYNDITFDISDWDLKDRIGKAITFFHECLHLKPHNFHHYWSGRRSLVYKAERALEIALYKMNGLEIPKEKHLSFWGKVKRFFRKVF